MPPFKVKQFGKFWGVIDKDGDGYGLFKSIFEALAVASCHNKGIGLPAFIKYIDGNGNLIDEDAI